MGHAVTQWFKTASVTELLAQNTTTRETDIVPHLQDKMFVV